MPGDRLVFAERCEIRRRIVGRESFRAIGRALGRPASTVSREVNRNGGRSRYRPRRAEAAAKRRAARPKLYKLEQRWGLAAEVTRLLELQWSPEQISARLRRDHPGDSTWQVSADAIYRSLFVQGRGGLRAELRSELRARKKRRPKDGKGQFQDMVMITERPAEADDRAVPGHWEGDLIISDSNRKTALGTLVERHSRFLVLFILRERRTAKAVDAALREAVATIPAHLARSLTWDQGKEMALHARFSAETGIQIYFCHPASPWQRGSNENTNGLLRQYFPKDTDFATIDDQWVTEVADRLNGRPRKTLNWDTPAEVYARAVATTP